MSTVPGTTDKIKLRAMNDGRTLHVEFGYYTLTPARARELAAELASMASYAERLPGIHERHVNLLASCALCRAEAGAQTDRLIYDEDSDAD